LSLNRGKRTVLVDLGTEEGVEVAHRLVDRADVLVVNFTRGVAEGLGLGYDEVSERRPDIVHCAVSAYGHDGPWGGGRGYEQLGQTTTGLTVRQGAGGRPAYQPMRRIADYGAGILGAFGVTLALLHRMRTGRGQRVATSLAQVCTFHQIPFVLGEEPSYDEHGRGPLRRLYRAADRWLFLTQGDGARPGLVGVPELADLAGLDGAALEAELERRIAARPVGEWLPSLRAAGFEALGCRTVGEMLDDPYAVARGLSVSREHLGMRRRTTGPSPRFSRTPVAAVRWPAPYGADTPAVLEELGLADRAAGLADRRVAVAATLSDFAIDALCPSAR
ncbi:MAG TPA: CoA transferase, partial [Solirubrobacteraceae bacterium]|nr:CoA transferase [Solirubrobacteraceae bacterium]